MSVKWQTDDIFPIALLQLYAAANSLESSGVIQRRVEYIL